MVRGRARPPRANPPPPTAHSRRGSSTRSTAHARARPPSSRQTRLSRPRRRPRRTTPEQCRRAREARTPALACWVGVGCERALRGRSKAQSQWRSRRGGQRAERMHVQRRPSLSSCRGKTLVRFDDRVWPLGRERGRRERGAEVHICMEPRARCLVGVSVCGPHQCPHSLDTQGASTQYSAQSAGRPRARRRAGLAWDPACALALGVLAR
mmetsp:Transcript_18358/g.55649  ORF Transcript_18358/g.55649 Transcript_18358/m.55649 type:complete len:210 (+) Transcript_18358:1534-2163(+)